MAQFLAAPSGGSPLGAGQSARRPRSIATWRRCCRRIPTGSCCPRPRAAPRSPSCPAPRQARQRDAQILAIATETPAALFQLGTFGGHPRLAGLTWGAEDLPAAVGAATSREEDGSFTPPYELARSLCLFGAAAAAVAPIETVYPAFRDLAGLEAYAGRARRDGFTGMLAIHPDQVPVINAAFTPTEAEIAHARRVVAAFEASPGAGALSLDGRMIDRPHLVQAQPHPRAAAGNDRQRAGLLFQALGLVLGAVVGGFLATVLIRWPRGRA